MNSKRLIDSPSPSAKPDAKFLGPRTWTIPSAGLRSVQGRSRFGVQGGQGCTRKTAEAEALEPRAAGPSGPALFLGGSPILYPGEVFFLPPDDRADGDAVSRRHVLLANCQDGAEMATVAYASRQPTEAKFGAANVLVNPTATGYHRSGFEFPTYVYPSRMVTRTRED